MVKMLTHRRNLDNLSCMPQAKDELVQAYDLQTQAAAHEGMDVSSQLESMEESELARQNAQLRRQLLEATASNNAISKSLQERAQSLSDTMDAKIKAESEAKVLQVQMKCMQKDMDVHKYELHLLRKQLQIKNDEREQDKKAADAKHLENVKTTARLESECQRLHNLIRQRLPGVTAIAPQMSAKCETHISTPVGKKRLPSIPTSSSRKLPTSSNYLQYQREIETLTGRLLSVEDEANFLKEALAKRTVELQEARKLCARTAMKLSFAQDRVEALSSIGSVPLTPQRQKYMPLLSIDHHQQALIDEEKSTTCVNFPKDEDAMELNEVDVNSEIQSSCNNDEQVDELSCAESWASALIAELSHLSNLHDNVSVITTESLSISKECKPDTMFASQELDFQTALQKVSQKLSYVGESLHSSKNQVNRDDKNYESASNFGLCTTTDTAVLDIEQHVNILEEILETKHLLSELGRAILELKGKASLQEAQENDDFGSYSVNASVDDHVSDDELVSEEEGKSVCKRGRILSRLQSMEDGDSTIKFSAKLEEKTSTPAKLEDTCDKMMKIPAVDPKFGGITNTSITSTASLEDIIDDGMIKSSASDTKFSGNSSTSSTTTSVDILSCPLHLALNGDQISDVASELEQPPLQEEAITHVLTQLDAHVAFESLLQAELELSRGNIATLEGELARVLQERDDVAKELADTCSLMENLEAELACSLAMVEELKLQVSSFRKSELADEGRHSTSTTHLNGLTLTQSSTHTSIKEEQDLAAARAQLADCQRSIHVMRKQMAFDIVHSTSQDVIIDELTSSDSSSKSSKSMDQKSHPTSPIMKELPKFDKCSSKTIGMKAMEHNVITLIQQDDNTSCSNISSTINPLQENKNSLHTLLSKTHVLEDMQSFEKCKVYSFDDNSTPRSLLIESTRKDCAIKPTHELLVKPPKLSTKSRIARFFNRANRSTKETRI